MVVREGCDKPGKAGSGVRRRWKPDVLQETRGKSEGKASKAFLILPPTAIPSGSVKQGDRIFILCICFAGLRNAQLFAKTVISNSVCEGISKRSYRSNQQAELAFPFPVGGLTWEAQPQQRESWSVFCCLLWDAITQDSWGELQAGSTLPGPQVLSLWASAELYHPVLEPLRFLLFLSMETSCFI